MSFVNVLESKYLSVTLNLTVAVLAGAFVVELIFSTNGSTTSTTVADVPSFDVCATNLSSTYKYILVPSYTPFSFVFCPAVIAVGAETSTYLSISLLYNENTGTPLLAYIPYPPNSQFPTISASPFFIWSKDIVASTVT